jgi:hypothetical protein
MNGIKNEACTLDEPMWMSKLECIQKELEPIAPSEDRSNVPTTKHHAYVGTSCQGSG